MTNAVETEDESVGPSESLFDSMGREATLRARDLFTTSGVTQNIVFHFHEEVSGFLLPTSSRKVRKTQVMSKKQATPISENARSANLEELSLSLPGCTLRTPMLLVFRWRKFSHDEGFREHEIRSSSI